MTMTVATAPAASEQCDCEMTLEQRIVRLDTLLCILFAGLTSHPMAKAIIPEAELEQLKTLLPKD